MKPTGTSSARLAASTVLLGAGVAIASQFVPAYALEDRFGLTIETITLFGKHGPFVVIAALGAIGALAWTVLSGSRQALVPLLGMGIAILLVFLLVDLPDAGEIGLYDTPGSGNLDATGTAAAGLWLELIGGLVIVLGTVGLWALDRDTIRAIRPGSSHAPRRRPPTETRRAARKTEN